MLDSTPSDKPLALAADLGAEVGREAGAHILKMSRAALLVNASRPGESTSEFKLCGLLVVAGLAMIGLGVWKGDAALQEHGVQMVEVLGAGYAASRGMAKLGAGLGSKADQTAK